jgi:hypothetical protein
MVIEKVRGTIKNLTAPDKNGAAKCLLNEYKVVVPRDLVSSIREGDDVQIAGIIKKGELHAMAARNYQQNKTARVDATNYILLMGIGGFMGIMFGVFAFQSIDSGSTLIISIDDFISILGFLTMAFAIRYIVSINSASNLVSYPKV